MYTEAGRKTCLFSVEMNGSSRRAADAVGEVCVDQRDFGDDAERFFAKNRRQRELERDFLKRGGDEEDVDEHVCDVEAEPGVVGRFSAVALPLCLRIDDGVDAESCKLNDDVERCRLQKARDLLEPPVLASPGVSDFGVVFGKG